jgi:hypothetical protein
MIMRTTATLAILGLARLAAGQPVAVIQPETGNAPATPAAPEQTPAIAPEIPTTFVFAGGIVFDGTPDAEGAAGDLRTLRLPASLSALVPLDSNNRLTVSLSETSSFYDFDNFTGFTNGPVTDPIDYGLEAEIGVGLIHIVDRNWSLHGGLSIGYAGEIDAELEDSLVYGARVGVRYTVSRDLAFGVTVGGRTRLEEDVFVIPVPTIDWQATDYWSVRIGLLEAGPGAPEAGIRTQYSLTDDLDLGGYVGVNFHQYRLADDNAVLPAGIVEDLSVPVGGYIRYRYSPRTTIVGNVQLNGYREIDLQSPSGNGIQDVELQPALGLGVGVEIVL